MEEMAACEFEGTKGQAKLVDALASRLNVEVPAGVGGMELLGSLAGRAFMELEFADKGL
jgi:hypothetical protein